MHPKIKGILRYLVILVFAGALLWLSVSNINTREGESKWDFIGHVWNNANKFYLLISALLAIISHMVRAARWRILIKPLGYDFSLRDSFLSVMVGYFVNLAIPRGGEVSRCYNLYKLRDIPFDQSFGTVVAERIIDMFFLLSFIFVAFLIESDKLFGFFMQLDYSTGGNGISLNTILIIGGAALLVAATLVYILKFRRILFLRTLSAAKKMLVGLKKGLKAVFILEKKALFYVYSMFIWVLYFFMSYTVILAFPETNDLSLLATISIFAIGGIAMAIPLPGGTGSYHVLVPLGLVILYGIDKDESVAFSFIFHGWQTVTVIIFGLISLLWSQYLIRKKTKREA